MKTAAGTLPKDLSAQVRAIAESAGREILRFYRSGEWTATAKLDDSPVTQADLASNDILVHGLESLGLAKIISEESDPARQIAADRYWLIDPLDGTKEFIAGRDTFVISIGLIEYGSPIFGLIHAPVTGETWWAEKGKGSFGPRGDKLFHPSLQRSLIAAGSRSLSKEALDRLPYSVGELRRIGSALKFCKLAEGEIDLYPRFGPTGEWDTAAGQIIAEEAGCQVVDLKTRQTLRYGKPGFLNHDGFFASIQGLELPK